MELNPLKRRKLFRSGSWDIVRHHSLSGQTRRLLDVGFMCERLIPVLGLLQGLLCCSLYTTLYRFRVEIAQVAKTNEFEL